MRTWPLLLVLLSSTVPSTAFAQGPAADEPVPATAPVEDAPVDTTHDERDPSAAFLRLVPLGVGSVAGPLVGSALVGIGLQQGGGDLFLPLLALGAVTFLASPAAVFVALWVGETLMRAEVSWRAVVTMTLASGLGFVVGAFGGMLGASFAVSLMPVDGDCYCYPQHLLGPPIGAVIGATLGMFAAGAVMSLVVDSLPPVEPVE